MSFTFIYLAVWEVGMGLHAKVYMWRSFYHVDPGDRTQFIRLGGKLLFLSCVVGLGWALHCGGLAVLGDALSIAPYLLLLKGY